MRPKGMTFTASQRLTITLCTIQTDRSSGIGRYR